MSEVTIVLKNGIRLKVGRKHSREVVAMIAKAKPQIQYAKAK